MKSAHQPTATRLPIPKKKPLKFVIPKKKAQLSISRLSETTTLRETIKSDFIGSFFHSLLAAATTVHDIWELYCPTLEKRWNEFKRENNEGTAAPSYGFLDVTKSTPEEIVSLLNDGISIGNHGSSVLGDPNLGVQLSRHADIIQTTSVDGRNRQVLMFKMFKGRVKHIAERLEHRCTERREPTFGFSTHISVKMGGARQHLDFYLAKMWYVYYYNEHGEIQNIPPQICPIALLDVSYGDARCNSPWISVVENKDLENGVDFVRAFYGVACTEDLRILPELAGGQESRKKKPTEAQLSLESLSKLISPGEQREEDQNDNLPPTPETPSVPMDIDEDSHSTPKIEFPTIDINTLTNQLAAFTLTSDGQAENSTTRSNPFQLKSRRKFSLIKRHFTVSQNLEKPQIQSLPSNPNYKLSATSVNPHCPLSDVVPNLPRSSMLPQCVSLPSVHGDALSANPQPPEDVSMETYPDEIPRRQPYPSRGVTSMLPNLFINNSLPSGTSDVSSVRSYPRSALSVQPYPPSGLSGNPFSSALLEVNTGSTSRTEFEHCQTDMADTTANDESDCLLLPREVIHHVTQKSNPNQLTGKSQSQREEKEGITSMTKGFPTQEFKPDSSNCDQSGGDSTKRKSERSLVNSVNAIETLLTPLPRRRLIFSLKLKTSSENYLTFQPLDFNSELYTPPPPSELKSDRPQIALNGEKPVQLLEIDSNKDQKPTSTPFTDINVINSNMISPNQVTICESNGDTATHLNFPGDGGQNVTKTNPLENIECLRTETNCRPPAIGQESTVELNSSSVDRKVSAPMWIGQALKERLSTIVLSRRKAPDDGNHGDLQCAENVDKPQEQIALDVVALDVVARDVVARDVVATSSKSSESNSQLSDRNELSPADPFSPSQLKKVSENHWDTLFMNSQPRESIKALAVSHFPHEKKGSEKVISKFVSICKDIKLVAEYEDLTPPSSPNSHTNGATDSRNANHTLVPRKSDISVLHIESSSPSTVPSPLTLFSSPDKCMNDNLHIQTDGALQIQSIHKEFSILLHAPSLNPMHLSRNLAQQSAGLTSLSLGPTTDPPKAAQQYQGPASDPPKIPLQCLRTAKNPPMPIQQSTEPTKDLTKAAQQSRGPAKDSTKLIPKTQKHFDCLQKPTQQSGKPTMYLPMSAQQSLKPTKDPLKLTPQSPLNFQQCGSADITDSTYNPAPDHESARSNSSDGAFVTGIMSFAGATPKLLDMPINSIDILDTNCKDYDNVATTILSLANGSNTSASSFDMSETGLTLATSSPLWYSTKNEMKFPIDDHTDFSRSKHSYDLEYQNKFGTPVMSSLSDSDNNQDSSLKVFQIGNAGVSAAPSIVLEVIPGLDLVEHETGMDPVATSFSELSNNWKNDFIDSANDSKYTMTALELSNGSRIRQDLKSVPSSVGAQNNDRDLQAPAAFVANKSIKCLPPYPITSCMFMKIDEPIEQYQTVFPDMLETSDISDSAANSLDYSDEVVISSSCSSPVDIESFEYDHSTVSMPTRDIEITTQCVLEDEQFSSSISRSFDGQYDQGSECNSIDPSSKPQLEREPMNFNLLESYIFEMVEYLAEECPKALPPDAIFQQAHPSSSPVLVMDDSLLNFSDKLAPGTLRTGEVYPLSSSDHSRSPVVEVVVRDTLLMVDSPKSPVDNQSILIDNGNMSPQLTINKEQLKPPICENVVKSNMSDCLNQSVIGFRTVDTLPNRALNDLYKDPLTRLICVKQYLMEHCRTFLPDCFNDTVEEKKRPLLPPNNNEHRCISSKFTDTDGTKILNIRKAKDNLKISLMSYFMLDDLVRNVVLTAPSQTNYPKYPLDSSAIRGSIHNLMKPVQITQRIGFTEGETAVILEAVHSCTVTGIGHYITLTVDDDGEKAESLDVAATTKLSFLHLTLRVESKFLEEKNLEAVMPLRPIPLIKLTPVRENTPVVVKAASKRKQQGVCHGSPAKRQRSSLSPNKSSNSFSDKCVTQQPLSVSSRNISVNVNPNPRYWSNQPRPTYDLPNSIEPCIQLLHSSSQIDLNISHQTANTQDEESSSKDADETPNVKVLLNLSDDCTRNLIAEKFSDLIQKPCFGADVMDQPAVLCPERAEWISRVDVMHIRPRSYRYSIQSAEIAEVKVCYCPIIIDVEQHISGSLTLSNSSVVMDEVKVSPVEGSHRSALGLYLQNENIPCNKNLRPSDSPKTIDAEAVIQKFKLKLSSLTTKTSTNPQNNVFNDETKSKKKISRRTDGRLNFIKALTDISRQSVGSTKASPAQKLNIKLNKGPGGILRHISEKKALSPAKMSGKQGSIEKTSKPLNGVQSQLGSRVTAGTGSAAKESIRKRTPPEFRFQGKSDKVQEMLKLRASVNDAENNRIREIQFAEEKTASNSKSKLDSEWGAVIMKTMGLAKQYRKSVDEPVCKKSGDPSINLHTEAGRAISQAKLRQIERAVGKLRRKDAHYHYADLMSNHSRYHVVKTPPEYASKFSRFQNVDALRRTEWPEYRSRARKSCQIYQQTS